MKVKYLFLFFSAFVFLNFIITPNCIFAYSSKSIYARANNNVYFYSQPIDNDKYKSFIIPNTYFVQLTGKAEDSADLFYSAIYLDVAGYVKKSDITPVQGTPNLPYASNLSFRVFIPNGIELRSSPQAQNPFNILLNLPYLENNLVFYGVIEGEEVVPQKENIWYYCKYIYNNNNYYGYVYYAFCDLLPDIKDNIEVLQNYEGELFPIEKVEETSNTVSPTFSKELKAIIIVIVCLPCFLLIYLLFKPTSLVVDNGKKGKTKIKRLKKSEYYELDD